MGGARAARKNAICLMQLEELGTENIEFLEKSRKRGNINRNDFVLYFAVYYAMWHLGEPTEFVGRACAAWLENCTGNASATTVETVKKNIQF